MKNIEIVDSMAQMVRSNKKLSDEQLEKERSLNSDREKSKADYYSARGLELMKRKRYEEAATSFEVVFQIQPDNAIYIDKLIECYEAMGDQRQAAVFEKKLTKILDKFKAGDWRY